MKFTAKIGQAFAVFTHVDMIDFNEQHRMSTHLFDVDDSPFKARERITQYGQTAFPLNPGIRIKTLLMRYILHPRKSTREGLVIAVENIDAQGFVAQCCVMHRSFLVQTYKEGCRRISNGTDSAGCYAKTTIRPVSADDIYGSCQQ